MTFLLCQIHEPKGGTHRMVMQHNPTPDLIVCDANCRYITCGSLVNPLQKEVPQTHLPCDTRLQPTALLGLLDRALLLANMDARAASAAVCVSGRHCDSRRCPCLRCQTDHAVRCPRRLRFVAALCDSQRGPCRYEDGNREHKMTKEVMVSFDRVRLSIRLNTRCSSSTAVLKMYSSMLL